MTFLEWSELECANVFQKLLVRRRLAELTISFACIELLSSTD